MATSSHNRQYQPTTFVERGASVSFTTPALTGARVRPAERSGLELLVNNPAGGRGIYIVPWKEILSLCRPSVYDMELIEHIAGLRSVTPATIRRATRQIASTGLAGRAAGSAACSLIAEERQRLTITNFQLLLRLVQQEEPPGHGCGPATNERPAELEQRAKRTMATIAPRLNLDPETIGSTLEQLAVLMHPIGTDTHEPLARLPHALAILKLLRQEVAALPTEADETAPALIEMVIITAELSISAADKALKDARASLDHITTLILAWQADAVALSRRLTRADWLMDGWERVCQLWWHDTRPAPRREALEEISALLPVIPREVGEWVGSHLDIEPAMRLRRMVLGLEDWRTGLSVHDLVARNELMLAL